MFFIGNLFHTARKEILVGISVDIFNRSFLILYNKQTEKYPQVFQPRICHTCRHIFPVQLYTC